jgi:hypothetical protein
LPGIDSARHTHEVADYFGLASAADAQSKRRLNITSACASDAINAAAKSIALTQTEGAFH